MGIDRQKTIRTLRLSMTCIFLFLLTWYYQVPESAWCLVTIWFVMYEYNTVGGVYTKSLLRFSGTALSAIYGMVIIYFCANNPLINTIALVPGLFVYTYFFMGGDKTYIGTIGAVTLTIVLLNYNDVDSAILRVFNVILGIIGSMFMIRFFYPQYARNLIIETLSTLIAQLSTIIGNYLNPSIPLLTIHADHLQYEHNTLASLPSFDRLLSEAKMETGKAPFFVPHGKAAIEQFKLLLQLSSVFFSLLSTDDVRADPWISAKLLELLSALSAIERRLLQQPNEPTSMAKKIISDTQNLQTQQATAAILTNMIKKAALLDEEVKQIVLIYDVYDIRIEKM